MDIMTWGITKELSDIIEMLIEEDDFLINVDDCIRLVAEHSDLIIMDLANLPAKQVKLFGELVDADCFWNTKQHFIIFEEQDFPAKTASAYFVWSLPRSKILTKKLKEYMDKVRKKRQKNQTQFDKKPFYLLEIVAYLRKNEFASSKELAHLCNTPVRSMQRYMQEFMRGWENITYDCKQKKWWMPGKISRIIEPEKFSEFPVELKIQWPDEEEQILSKGKTEYKNNY